MARNDPTIYMRIPQELKDKLDQAAAANRKSLTAEVVSRLERSFAEQPSHVGAGAPLISDERLMEIANSLISGITSRRPSILPNPEQAKEQSESLMSEALAMRDEIDAIHRFLALAREEEEKARIINNAEERARLALETTSAEVRLRSAQNRLRMIDAEIRTLDQIIKLANK